VGWSIPVFTVVGLVGCGRMHFDPVGGGSPGDDGSTPSDAGPPTIYANTDKTLFRIDPATFAATLLFDLSRADSVTPQISDLALDSAGTLFAAEQFDTKIYRVDLATGACTIIPLSVGTSLYGAAFVPKGVVDPNNDVMIGAGSDSNLYKVDVTSGVATLIGPLGAMPSGDLVWTGSALVLTIEGSPSDVLATVDLGTGHATPIGSTGQVNVYGLAMIAGALIGFVNGGDIVRLDPATGAATHILTSSNHWGGATTTP
jgi:hypothetical protein